MRGLIHFTARTAWLAVFLFAVVAASVAACGGSGGDVDKRSAGFELNVLPTSFELGGSAQFELKVQDTSDTVRVEVLASDAHALKAAYIDLGYDPSTYTAIGAQSTGLLANGSGCEIVELAVTGEAGTMHLGQVLALPQTAVGFTGSGVVATFTFTKQPMPRAVSSAPRNNFSKTQLSWASPGVLAWRFSSAGDYDQNGEVNISDLTPLSSRLGLTVAPAKFPFESMESVTDGDLNGEVNVADITPIGANYGVSARKYQVFSSLNEIDYPTSPLDPPEIAPLAEVHITETQDTAGQARLGFSYVVSPQPEEYTYFWVRPVDNDGTSGIASNSVPFTTPNQAPTASIVPNQSSGLVPLTVNFDCSASSDADGSIVRFEYDWDGNGSAFTWEDFDTESLVNHIFDSGGTYVVMVRVTDDDGAQSTAQTVIDVVEQAEPIAAIEADVTLGMAPLHVNLNAADSIDNGGIVKYEWDLNGDGTFEVNSGAVPVIAHDYFNAGSFDATVRVTDEDSLTDTAAVTINVSPAAGAPLADVQATPTSGTIPFSVDFDGTLSSDTDGGTIVNYEWDWEGDGIFDNATPGPTTQFAYSFAGVYNATLRVTDDNNQTGLASVQITALSPGASGAEAVLLANPRYGPAPLSVYFDATNSYSTDGPITNFEWDWDGDGTYDEDTDGDGTRSHTFQSTGIFDSTVRVTDGNSAQDEKIMLVMVTSDSLWPPDDSVFALPTQSHCSAGEAVGIELYCNASASPLLYVAGLRMTMPEGNTYVENSFNTGALGGASAASIDGLWAQMMPTAGFLLAPDNFIQINAINVDTEAIDVAVTPLGGSSLTGATGALCNFELNINNDSSFGFQRFKDVNRTYYYDENQSPEYFWANENVAGLPGVDVQ